MTDNPCLFCVSSHKSYFLLSVRDADAQKKYGPELPPLPEDIDDDEDSVKIIRLVKNKEPLVSNLTIILCAVSICLYALIFIFTVILGHCCLTCTL